MFSNYFKIAIRNLLKQKIFSLINVFGLAIGITCCLLIFLFVQYEWQHDKFHENIDSIYRVLVKETGSDGAINYSGYHPTRIAEGMEEAFPAVLHASNFIRSNAAVYIDNQPFGETIALVNAPFLEMFTFPLLAGNPETALQAPDQAVISESAARRFFGEEKEISEMIGETLLFNKNRQSSQTFILSGVFQDPPKTSSLVFDILIPIENHRNYPESDDWGGIASLYIQLSNPDAVSELQAAFPSFVNTQYQDRANNFRDYGRVVDNDEGFQLELQPLSEVYMGRSIRSSYERRSKAVYSYILGGIALLVLFIACINFMTLSIGGSANRAMEVGMRKVMGAKRFQLIKQFWGETLLLALLALALGISLAELCLPVFNDMAGKELNIDYLGNAGFLLVLVFLLGITGIIAGSYPALILSGFSPTRVFRGGAGSRGKNRLTRALVVLQYTLSIILLIGTILISQQLQYMRSKDLGYTKDQILVVNLSGDDTQSLSDRFKTELRANPQVADAASADRAFTRGSSTIGFQDANGILRYARRIRIDQDYLRTLDISLHQGRNFDKDISSDPEHSIIVNESLVKAFGLEDPVGKPLTGWADGGEDPIIIGIVKDYHFDSLHDNIQPLVLTMNPNGNPLNYTMVKIHPDNIPATVEEIKAAWAVAAPNSAFRFYFLDEELAGQYNQEERWQTILGYSTGFALLISCLGLFGLSSLAVSRRIKEIGIRRVLGASAGNVIMLLSSDFIRLLVIANLVAWPLAWFGMEQWLNNFAYRIDISLGVFIFAGSLTILAAFLTISYQAIKAALANPVDALHYE